MSRTEATAAPAIVNGLKTCGPLIAAALNWDSVDLEAEFDQLLGGARALIAAVETQLATRDLVLNDLEHAAVNAVCVRAAAANWRATQEIDPAWPPVLVKALLASGLNAETPHPKPFTGAGRDLAAELVAAADVLCVLTAGGESPRVPDEYPQAVTALYRAVERAIETLVRFHVPCEEAETIRHHLTAQAGRLFVAVAEREQRLHRQEQRRRALDRQPEEPPLAIDLLLRHFDVAMDAFVDALCRNSRELN